MKTILLPPQKSKFLSLLTADIRSELVLVISILLSLVLSSAMVAAQTATQVSTVYGQGTITTSVSPALTASRAIPTPVQYAGDGAGTITTSVSEIIGTPVQHAGDSAGTITASVSKIIGTPVEHAGGGVITTSAGPTIPPAATTIHGQAAVFAPLAGDPSFTVSAACAANSTGVMTITNVGGDMPVPLHLAG